MRKTRLEELTIKHNFMFGAVMIDPENCKGFLERKSMFILFRHSVGNLKKLSWKTEEIFYF